ncbi:hypothetical protein KIN20_033602 [Parelaphostrongylus tenuis]|uniref:Uncharacterized protein n=1 Tax=Parelaphostrongylus tenuis TaxID=148309 RepID=A0AAD5WJ08_PARTN|nr:hypothetical protein KIN20_033602 [Parelaphostrongylus tenuis]
MKEGFTSSDEEEEVLFTKEMVRTLRKSAHKVSSRPASSLSDTSGISTMSTISGQKSRSDDSAECVCANATPSTCCSSPKERRLDNEILLMPKC